MLTLILVEMIVVGILLTLVAYFYNEAQWQKWSDEVLSKPNGAKKKRSRVPDPSTYKSDGVVY